MRIITRGPALSLSFVGFCAVFAMALEQANCGTLAAVAPAVIDGLDRALVAEIEAAKEAKNGQRERDLNDARRLYAELEASRAAVEEASKQLTRAFVLLQHEAEERARAQKTAQEARERRAAAALQRRLAKLRLIRDAPAGTGGAS